MTTEKKLDVAENKESVERVEPTRDLPVFVPETDIYEKADSMLVLCDMPGVDEKRVEITLENNVLTITGRQDTTTPADHRLLYRGYVPGIFRRSFTLATEIDRNAIRAKIANGVLELVLPKKAEVQPRTIKVEAGA